MPCNANKNEEKIMRRAIFVNDGLWKCLCPSFDSSVLRKAVMPALRSSTTQRLTKPRTTFEGRCCRYSTNGTLARTPLDSKDRDLGSLPHPLDSGSHGLLNQGEDSSDGYDMLQTTPLRSEQLASMRIDTLKETLLLLRGRRGHEFDDSLDRHSRIIQLVSHLVRDRGQRLTAFEYESMMDAMADPQGSAKGVSKILDDMVAQDIKPTAAICKSALDALMNHPDYFTRDEVLQIMRQSWFPIDTPVRQSIIVGMLRDEQCELAVSRLMEMIAEGARIEAWVYDLFIIVFGKMGHVDEMMAILNVRQKSESSVPDSLQCFALEVCSEAAHYEGVIAGWNRLVRTGKMRPSDGLLENALATASRYGDAALASEVLDLISERTKTRDYHYEAVSDAFVHSGDVAGAMRILAIMEATGIKVHRTMLSELCTAVKSSPELLVASERALVELRQAGVVPPALVAAVLLCKAETQGSRAAMSLLESFEELCGAAAHWRVMQDMIIHSRDQETTRRLCGIYESAHAETDEARSPAVLGRLVLQCVSINNMDLAFHFVERQLASGSGDIKNKYLTWVQPLVEAAVVAEDKRIWRVIDELLKVTQGAAAKNIRAILQKGRVLKQA